MDSNTLVTIVVSGLLGFFMVKFFQIRKELAQIESDRQIEMIYSSIQDVRDNIEKEVERLTDKIDHVESNIYSEMDRKFSAFSNAIIDADRRIDEITNLFPNAPKGKFHTYMKHNNNLYSRIESIEEVDYSGVVHDFEIAEPHEIGRAHV